jgi:hypothetical protein
MEYIQKRKATNHMKYVKEQTQQLRLEGNADWDIV